MSILEKTFSLIKPDAVSKQLSGAINSRIETHGLQIIAQKMLWLDPCCARVFYAVHKDRPFFGELCDFLCSGPVIAQVLRGENAVQKYRNLMGATKPEEWADGTLRKEFGEDLCKNAVHGSDSSQNAALEISLFFSGFEVFDC